MPNLNQPAVPLAYRVAHFDATTLQQPLSILSAIRSIDAPTYEQLYYNPNVRKFAIESGKIGWGSGGTIWSSINFDDSEDNIATYGMTFTFWRNEALGYKATSIGWTYPRVKMLAADFAETIWEKVSGYSFEPGIRKLHLVTAADAGTGPESMVIGTVTFYGFQLVNNQTLYETIFDENGNSTEVPRQWVYYGIVNGIKGWYCYGEGDTQNHALLSDTHSDTEAATPSTGELIAVTTSPEEKWKKLDAPSQGMKYILTADSAAPLGLSWKPAPATNSITNDSIDKALTLVNDLENPGANKWYIFDPTSGRQWASL